MVPHASTQKTRFALIPTGRAIPRNVTFGRALLTFKLRTQSSCGFAASHLPGCRTDPAMVRCPLHDHREQPQAAHRCPVSNTKRKTYGKERQNGEVSCLSSPGWRRAGSGFAGPALGRVQEARGNL